MPSAILLLEDLVDDERRFRFLAGRPSLDLTATVGERWRRNFERLATPGDLSRWVTEAGLLGKAPRATAGDLERFRLLRAVIYRAARSVVAGEGPSRADERSLTDFASEPPLRPVLSRGAVRWTAEDPASGVLSTLARDAIDLLTGPLSDRIRECASEDCALLFVDTSRPGQRRWCSSSACGARARSAAYRSRKRV